jgi:5-methylcytosine-specific restriction endonuclease McrA
MHLRHQHRHQVAAPVTSMKLLTLKPRLQAISTARIAVLTAQPDVIERKRGSAGVRDRNEIKARDHGLCQACKRMGKTTLGEVVDHIEPLHLGGSDESCNKELLCATCHDAKSAREAAGRARPNRW